MKKSQADIMKIVNKKTAEALRVRANILDPDGNPANLEAQLAEANARTFAALSFIPADVEIGKLRERKEQLANLQEAASELLKVAKLRGDNVLPSPDEDPKLWTVRMQLAWWKLEAALDGNDRAAELEGKCTTKS